MQKTQHAEILPVGLTGLSYQSRYCSTRRIGHERQISGQNESYSRSDDRVPSASNVVEVGEYNSFQEASQAHCNHRSVPFRKASLDITLSTSRPLPLKPPIDNSEVRIEAVKATNPYYQKATKSILGFKRSVGKYSTSSFIESTGRSTLISRIKCGKGHDMEVIDVARDKWKASIDCAKCQAKELEKLRRFVCCRLCLYYLCTKCMYLERALNRKS